MDENRPTTAAESGEPIAWEVRCQDATPIRCATEYEAIEAGSAEFRARNAAEFSITPIHEYRGQERTFKRT